MIPAIAEALTARGYDTMTPVQLAVTDPALNTADLLVSAQTGSGKTVGFGLAIAPTLLGEDGVFGPAGLPLALVIAPTRELAMQVRAELTWLYAMTGAVVTSCVGGMDMRDERRALDRGAHIVVATPGRLRDHITRGSLNMADLRAVVLDEADEMLDLGFREDLEFILAAAPETRRTLMFSATVPRGIAALAQSYQKDAVRITTQSERTQHADIEYRALVVAERDSENAIINVLRFHDARNAIVFCNTRVMVNRLTARFSNRGFSVVALSGELSQTERTHALQAMRDGRARVCVATDVAARGIDLPNLELVVHAELPTNAEGLLHRSGRTGRAGRKGVSALIIPVKSRKKAERLLGFAKITATWAAAPSADEILRKDEERLLADPAWTDPIQPEEKDFVSTLLGLHAPEQIAAAYLRLYRARQSAPEDLAGADTPSATREPRSFGPSTWFSLDAGRNDRAEARWVLPLICKAGGITKDEIGAIRIQSDETFIEISQPAVGAFVAQLGPDMTVGDGRRLRRMDGPPDLARPAPYAGRKPDRAPRAPRPAYAPAPEPDEAPPPSLLADVAPVAPVKPRKPRTKAQGDTAAAMPSDNPGPVSSAPAARPAEPAYTATPAPGPPAKPRKKPRPTADATPPVREDASGWHPDNKPGKPKPRAKPGKDGKPTNRAQNAADTSRRFTPPAGSTPTRAGDSPGFVPYKKRTATGPKPKGKQGGFAKPFAPRPGKPGGKGT
ncbi:MAG: DEAD/DEAH box helicase [Rhodobacterales bacterium]|nr:DEAD/DEAH box helicase [Rhodobacterales bacterium]